MPSVEWQQNIEEEIKDMSSGLLKLLQSKLKYYSNALLTLINPELLFLTNYIVQLNLKGKVLVNVRLD